MGILSDILSKIFGHPRPRPPEPPTTYEPQKPAEPSPPIVDVAAVLDDLAAKNPEKLDWRKSIVDLLKLLGLDSSFTARKSLAAELHYAGDPDDSPEMNTWLHKQVIIKLAENGGKVPEELVR